MGVLRYVLSFDGEPVITGNLEVASPQLDRVMAGDALAAPVVAYLVDERRMRDMLRLAADGVAVEDLMFSLDAAAAERHRCPHCGDYADGCPGTDHPDDQP